MTARRLADFEPLSPAERVLVEGLDEGRFDRLEGGDLPERGDEGRTVRADLLRLLIVGGPDAPRVHEKGVRLSGALIVGTLDLEGCRIPRDIGLADCLFEAPVILRSAVIDTLLLDGSHLPGLIAERLEARGDVLLRRATVAGPTLLGGARLGGGLVADGASLLRVGDTALDASGADARGGMLLRGATVSGRVVLNGARTPADLDFSGADIEGASGVAVNAEGVEVRGDILLRHARVTGACRFEGARCDAAFDVSAAKLSCDTASPDGAPALDLSGAAIRGAFLLRSGAQIEGLLDLRGASVGLMVDDPASWPRPGQLALDRCLYGAILAAPADAPSRLRWLALQTDGDWGEDFLPQPYEHLAKVLLDMGHDEDAGLVLFEKERLQRRARRCRARSPFLRGLLWARDTFLRVTLGYGRRSLLALFWLAALWAAGAGILALTWEAEAMRPNLPFVLRAPEWLLCSVEAGQRVHLPSLAEMRSGLARPGQSQLACYLAQPEAASYPAFNPWMFSLDALLPAVDTGQRGFWSPDTRSPLGAFAKGWVYLLTVSGWALGLLAVAGFTGLVRAR